MTVLRAIQSNQPGLTELGKALRKLAKVHGRITDYQDGELLLGLEGQAASHYFGVLGCGFRAAIGFTSRQRRPPSDPANALLSFGYVLLGNLMASLVEARGMDPAVGFFHAPRPGRASLALDLLEEFRHPVVDRFVLKICNLRMV